MTFIDTLLTYARAGSQAVAVVSHEESSVLGELAPAAEQAGRRLATWSLTHGWVGLRRAQAQGDPRGAVKAVQEFPDPASPFSRTSTPPWRRRRSRPAYPSTISPALNF